MRQQVMYRWGFSILLLTVAVAACDSDSPTEPPPGADPAEVVVTPAQVAFTEVGATEQLSATVLDADGEEIEGAEVTWASSDTAVATVSETGLVEAVGEGTAQITATSGEAEDAAEVVVELDEEENGEEEEEED